MSVRVERVLDQLKLKQVEHAVDSLANPRDRDSFEYGRVCGFFSGLVYAEKLLLETEKNAERKHDDDR